MRTDYRAKLYRLVFGLAAIYNVAFGLWASLWPRAFFDWVGMAPPNYPSLWSCLGMVVGLYGILYADAAWRLERARLIILVGLVGKILGPIGWFMVTSSGEWPRRTLPLVVFNDFVWWLPFALFLLDDTHLGARLRRAAPWACAVANSLAAVAILAWLRGGTEAIPSLAARAAYIAEHTLVWRAGWALWMIAALSLVAFYAWWGGWISSMRAATAAFLIALAGLACDLFAEALFIGWLPEHIEAVAPLGSLLSGGAANALYTAAGIILTVATPSLRGALRIWAWIIWASGCALTIFTLLGNITGVTISTAILMCLLCPWVAVFGWKMTRDGSASI